MPRTKVIFYCDENGSSAAVKWLEDLSRKNLKAWMNCRARIELLGQFGHELRRPAADYLRDGIYELRAKEGHVQYRLLYFFHGRNVAILTQGLMKESAVPVVEIERALKLKRLFEEDPKAHTYEQEN